LNSLAWCLMLIARLNQYVKTRLIFAGGTAKMFEVKIDALHVTQFTSLGAYSSKSKIERLHSRLVAQFTTYCSSKLKDIAEMKVTAIYHPNLGNFFMKSTLRFKHSISSSSTV
jgi:hypothetical protein